MTKGVNTATNDGKIIQYCEEVRNPTSDLIRNPTSLANGWHGINMESSDLPFQVFRNQLNIRCFCYSITSWCHFKRATKEHAASKKEVALRSFAGTTRWWSLNFSGSALNQRYSKISKQFRILQGRLVSCKTVPKISSILLLFNGWRPYCKKFDQVSTFLTVERSKKGLTVPVPASGGN